MQTLTTTGDKEVSILTVSNKSFKPDAIVVQMILGGKMTTVLEITASGLLHRHILSGMAKKDCIKIGIQLDEDGRLAIGTYFNKETPIRGTAKPDPLRQYIPIKKD